MDYLKTLCDLISIDTTVPPGRNYGKAVDYLEPLFQQVGCSTHKINILPEHAEGREGRVALICHRREMGKPRLIFYGHIDVVPAEGWDAFKPRVEEGRVYGRGSADMKGAIVSLLMALEGLQNRHLKYDVSIAITADEELSQASQLRYLATFLNPVIGARVFSLDSNFGFVSVAGLGALQMEIKVKGRSVHSGLSHLGINAVEQSVPVLQALLELKSKVLQKKSRVAVHPDTGLKFMEPRLNINMIHGGLKVNIVPDECVISVDRRLVPEEKLDDAEKEIMDALAAVRGVDWQVNRVMSIPTIPPCEDPMVDELAAVIQKVTGRDGRYGEMGSGDLSPVVNHDWNGVDFGLGVIRTECNIHGKDEFVYRKDVEDLSRIIAEFLRA
ncbi:MAG: M20/M25/M40 family metallo-hydrolase [Dehalococcoidia bacterium]|nr:MAG: M20/M25/M40 family metallo-hydrolase [Dehalococcoidia bacterium]